MKKALVCLLLFAFSSSFSQTFTLSDTQFKVGSYYRTYNILYGLGNSTLLSDCYSNLDSIVTFLNTYSAIKLEIGVHCDFRGSVIANNNLTMSRAVSIMNYVVSKGIEKNRLKAVGYGETKPLISEEQYKKLCPGTDCEVKTGNRRIEYKIIAI